MKLVGVMEDFEPVARRAVAEAGPKIHAAWLHSKNVHFKGAVDLVTDTDREVEALIVGHLRRAFPDHLVVAEEASAGAPLRPRSGSDYVWYLDPLDGTTNFAHSFPHFAVSLALAHGPVMVFGIVCDPLRNETFVACRGAGAMLNEQPIKVSTTRQLDHALLATGLPYDRRERADFYLGFMADFVRQARDIRRAGSAALDLCYVACGRFDGFWEWKLHPWDTAAGSLIVREAGGAVSDFQGDPFDLYGEQTLASNAALHPTLIRVLTARLGAAASHPPQPRST